MIQDRHLSQNQLTMPHIPMLQERNVRKGFFERSQFDAVCARLPPALQDVVLFKYLTGWRKTEVLTLQWAQVDRQDGVIRLEPGTTKNNEPRTFPYSALPELADLIARRWAATKALGPRICPWVFHRYADGKPIKSYYKAWQRACVATGCPGRIPHDFRRTACRNFVRSGTSENVAMKLSGHKTASVFRRYDITSEEDKRAALGRLAEQSPWERSGVARDETRDADPKHVRRQKRSRL